MNKILCISENIFSYNDYWQSLANSGRHIWKSCRLKAGYRRASFPWQVFIWQVLFAKCTCVYATYFIWQVFIWQFLLYWCKRVNKFTLTSFLCWPILTNKICTLTIFSMTSALVQKLACYRFWASALVIEKIVNVARTDEQIKLVT